MKTGKRQGKGIILICLASILALACNPVNPEVDYTSLDGIYTCQESSSHTGVREYFTEIDRVAGAEDQYIISNFHNLGENEFIFTELENDTLWIFNQAITDISVNGKGVVDPDFRTINLYYETDDGITVLDFYANLTR